MTNPNFISSPEGVELRGEVAPSFVDILTPDALAFVAKLQRAFGARRLECLALRQQRQTALDRGEALDFLPDTRHIRESDWRCAPIPADLRDRRVEITGPTDRKMVINALNSGAKMFMADFEDANSPTWANMIEGQINLRDAVRRTITFTNPDGKKYRLNEKSAVLLVRPRGWHLTEKHLLVDGEPVAGGLVRLRSLLFPQREGADRARQRALLLPAEAGKPSRGAHLERCFQTRAEGTGHSARDDSRHRADRNDTGRLRDGRNSLRAARSFRRAQLRPLGLHFFLHQTLPEQTRFPPRRSRARSR